MTTHLHSRATTMNKTSIWYQTYMFWWMLYISEAHFQTIWFHFRYRVTSTSAKIQNEMYIFYGCMADESQFRQPYSRKICKIPPLPANVAKKLLPVQGLIRSRLCYSVPSVCLSVCCRRHRQCVTVHMTYVYCGFINSYYWQPIESLIREIDWYQN